MDDTESVAQSSEGVSAYKVDAILFIILAIFVCIGTIFFMSVAFSEQPSTSATIAKIIFVGICTTTTWKLWKAVQRTWRAASRESRDVEMGMMVERYDCHDEDYDEDDDDEEEEEEEEEVLEERGRRLARPE
jgi:hypothetical protein